MALARLTAAWDLPAPRASNGGLHGCLAPLRKCTYFAAGAFVDEADRAPEPDHLVRICRALNCKSRAAPRARGRRDQRQRAMTFRSSP